MPILKTMSFAAVIAAASVLPSTVTAQTISPPEFANKAAVSNTFEIESSRLAVTMAQRAEVKAFAQQMIADHTKAATDMQAALTSDKMAPLPASLDAVHQAKLDTLKAASGANFDTAYVAAQRAAHDEAVSLFSNYSQSGAPGALKTFAANTLPTLRQHKDHVAHLTSKP